jgi:hypothetical protein
MAENKRKSNIDAYALSPAFGRLRQEGGEFEASLSYVVRPCLKK